MRHLFNKTLTVQRKTKTSDGQGGWIQEYQPVAVIKGRISPASIAERTVAAQEQATITHMVYCSADADIRRNDRVTDGAITIEIIGIRNPSMADHHLECEGVEIQHE